jgi:hypothetical protein
MIDLAELEARVETTTSEVLDTSGGLSFEEAYRVMVEGRGAVVGRASWSQRAIGIRRPFTAEEYQQQNLKTRTSLADYVKRPFMVLLLLDREGVQWATRWNPYFEDFQARDWVVVRKL